jgi:hypothetical protein
MPTGEKSTLYHADQTPRTIRNI